MDIQKYTVTMKIIVNSVKISSPIGRGKSLTRTPLRIGVDIVKNIVEKHGCFVLVVN